MSEQVRGSTPAAPVSSPASTPLLRRHAAGTGPDVAPPAVHDVLGSPGASLDASFVSSMGPAFDGMDFSHVRVHTDTQAAASAEAVRARAYTVGRHVVFGAGEYRPHDHEGRRLLAHELTHVAQQSAGSALPPAGRLPISTPSDASERSAALSAGRVAGGQRAMRSVAARTGPVLCREPLTLFRGEAVGVGPARPGSNIHDFGDGLYLTNDLSVARTYAATRVDEFARRNPGGPPTTERVLTATFDRSTLGNTLDLTQGTWGTRWQEYMRRVQPGGQTTEQLIRQQNEAYNSFFTTFLREHNQRLESYDSVIGPEYVRGGRQVCIRNPGIASQVRGLLKLVPPGTPPSGGTPPRTPPSGAGTPPRPAAPSTTPGSTSPAGPGGKPGTTASVGTPDMQPVIPGGPSSRGQAIGAGLQLVFLGANFLLNAINDVIQADRVRQALAGIEPGLAATRTSRPDLGVLLAIFFHQQEAPSFSLVQPGPVFSHIETATGPTREEAVVNLGRGARLRPEPGQGKREVRQDVWIPPVRPSGVAGMATPFRKLFLATFNGSAKLQEVEWSGVLGFDDEGEQTIALPDGVDVRFFVLRVPNTLRWSNGPTTMSTQIPIQDKAAGAGGSVSVVNLDPTVFGNVSAACVFPANDETLRLFANTRTTIDNLGQLNGYPNFRRARWIRPENIRVLGPP